VEPIVLAPQVVRHRASALSRFNAGSAPWNRPDHFRVADSTADFAAGNLWAAISVTAGGQTEISNESVWTGAATPLTAGASADTCGDWTSASATGTAVVGNSSKTDSSYFNEHFDDIHFTQPCNFQYALLYCLQE
jgi:hypothetical protein